VDDAARNRCAQVVQQQQQQLRNAFWYIFYDIIKIFSLQNKDGRKICECYVSRCTTTTRLKHHVINNSSDARVISSFINCLPDDDDDWMLHVSER
jgi:hypothetical protein